MAGGKHSMEHLAFIFSALGTICVCVSPLLKGKNMKLILLCVFSANALVGASYLVTGAVNGAVTCFVSAAQAIINYFFDRKNKSLPVWLIAVYALAFITVNILVFSHIFDLITMIASMTFIMCIIQKTGAKYRAWVLINTLLWMLYDILMHTYGPLLIHGIQLVTVLSGVMIHDLKKKHK